MGSAADGLGNLNGQPVYGPVPPPSLKAQKSAPTPKPPSSTQGQARTFKLHSGIFDDDDDDEEIPSDEDDDFVFNIIPEERVQEEAEKLRKKIRRGLCDALVRKVSKSSTQAVS